MAVRRPTHNHPTSQIRKPATDAAGTEAPRPRRRRRSGAARNQQSAGRVEVAVSNDLETLGDDVVETVADDNRTFADLGVPSALVTALAAAGVTKPFPIQAATLPDSLAGKDVLGRGRTGSGKTYAFVLPVLARLAASATLRRPNHPRALILAPTRELATQIQASIAPLADQLGLRSMTIFGGVGHGPQITGLRKGADIVVACPGRLEDHVQAGHAKLGSVEITVLDEADHMADLGFLPAVRRILEQTPADAQRLLFSATLDAGVDVLVRRFMTDPITHSVDSARSPVARMTHHVLHVQSDSRLPVLVDLTAAPGRSLVFTRTKYGAKALTKKLIAQGVPAVELHGNLSQGARTRNLEAFSDGTARTLVATDIAARGIHVDGVTLVIHADPPVEHKAYLHRSGRTARAGAEGTVVTLMTDDQVRDVRDLTRKAGIAPTITKLDATHPLLTELAPGDRTYVAPPTKQDAPQQSSGRRSSSRTKPGARAGGARSEGARAGGARSGGARAGDAREGARAAGARSEGARAEGARSEGARSQGARAGAARAGGARADGNRADGARSAGPSRRPSRRRGRRRPTGQQAA